MDNLFENYFHSKKEFLEYTYRKLMKVCDETSSDDMRILEYLYTLYRRVLFDGRIKPEERSLLDILDKLEEDLMADREKYKADADFILEFLEVSLLSRYYGPDSGKTHHIALGRIYRIKKTWLLHERTERENNGYRTPAEIKAYLDDYIISQEEAKRVVATAVYGHRLRVENLSTPFASNIVLLIGPSGCGKTEIMRKIREITDFPMVFTDVSSLGASQFRGRHKEDVLLSLWEEAGRDKKVAETGIIFMDEFDKLLLPAISERGVNMHDDVQSQLLTMLEGSDVELRYGNRAFTMNTSHILFVLSGAFQGIEECIREEQKRDAKTAGNIGFGGVLEKDMDLDIRKKNITHTVLMDYGMKRELAGRISSIAVLEKLSREQLKSILIDAKDNIPERYAREIKLSSGSDLIFTEDAYDAIVDIAMKEDVGARALHSIIYRGIKECLYHAPSAQCEQIIVNGDTIRGAAGVEYRGLQDPDWNESR
ncbi:MAG: AAA family ATPase [Lachnospiraceae bacterium]|nr:AAA family ATPase [Lachnospiraceae bacterium]